MAALDDGETRIVHENGRVLELAGEQDDGEWFACDGDDCFAQGYYERDGDVAYYCYRWDISYRNEAAIKDALREMVPAGG